MTDYMAAALEEAYSGIRSHHGGPFGSVIVRDGVIVGRGHNCVLLNNDPTAHGEMMAIRDACRNLGTYDLTGCALYTTAEPCPMCLGGILWANITEIYYGCNRYDTDKIGFRDDKFYECISGENKPVRISECDREECLKLFGEYSSLRNKTIY